MDVTTLRAVLEPAEGLLLPLGDVPSVEALGREVRGIELFQPGVATDYRDLIVLATVPTRDDEALDAVRAACAGAAAIIVHPDTTSGLTVGDSPLLLRRSPWVTSDALLRALTALTRTPLALTDDDAGSALERDALWAVHRRESALVALLQGATDAAMPATLVGLRPDRDHAVIAAGVAQDDLDQFRVALAAEFPDKRGVVTDGIYFAVLPVDDALDEGMLVTRLRTRIGRAITPREDLPIAVGPIVAGVFALHESAASARQILRALRVKLGERPLSADAPLRVATAADVDDALAVIRARDALRPLAPTLTERLRVLAAYDREHGGELLHTVFVALVHRRNASEAARSLGIHANSLRTRFERIREIAGIDLTAPVSELRAIIAFLSDIDIQHLAMRSQSFSP